VKPEDSLAFKSLLDQTEGTNKLRERMLEAQLLSNHKAMRQIAESLKSIESQAALRAAEQMGKINWPKMAKLTAPRFSHQLAEVVRGIAQSESFNVARLNAVEAIAGTLMFHNRNKELEANIAASFAKLSGTTSVRSLASVFARQIEELQQFESGFAQSMVQTLKSAFERLEQRNQASLAQLAESINAKIEALPDKMEESVWVRGMNALIALVTIAGVVLAFAQYLDSKEQSKALTAFVIQATKTLQEIANNTTNQPDIYYQVKRIVKLKSAPHNQSGTLTKIPRGEEVLLISRKHKWIFVAFTDDSGTQYGWVSKKYLRKSD